MALNQTPAAQRIHIGFFGRRNAGKSSLLNAVTGPDLAVVSEVKGTTTDPVSKTMELLPLGPVMLIDTPGIDDEGELGKLRVKKSRQVLNKTDLAVLVVDGTVGETDQDRLCFRKSRCHMWWCITRQTFCLEKKGKHVQTGQGKRMRLFCMSAPKPGPEWKN